MALKDLISQRAALTEEAIEQIVADYVRYDTDEKAVVPMPAFNALANRAKVLVYLVALQGWPFVIDEPVSAEAKPADLEKATGIHGGSLRPVLKELKDGHFIVSKTEGYSVRVSNLEAIRAEVSGGQGAPRPRRSTPKRAAESAKTKGDADSAGAVEPKGKASSGPGNEKRRKSSGNPGEKFNGWLDEGYFDKARNLSDVVSRFRKEGIIIPATSIPKYLLAALRAGRLERDHADKNGRRVWEYKTKEAAK